MGVWSGLSLLRKNDLRGMGHAFLTYCSLRIARHKGRTSFTKGRRKYGNMPTTAAAVMEVMVAWIVMSSHSRLRHSSSPRNTRDERRATIS